MGHSQVLIDIIKAENVKVMVEIGVWKTRLCRTILRSECKNILTEYWAVDQWKHLGPEHGHMGQLTNEQWDDLYFGACKYMPYFPSLRVLRLSSEEAAKLFLKNYFDLVFIDASHFYDDVMSDIENWLPFVKEGGLITGHDYGTRRHPGVKIAVDEFFGKRAVACPGSVWTVQV